MKVMLTGAFGNIGVSTIKDLIKQGHDIRCFDIKTKLNEKTAATFGNKIEVVWGDICSAEEVNKAAEGQDAIIHLCFIISSTMSVTGKSSEDDPDWSEKINIGGTKNVINAIKAQPKPPVLVFASSVSVFGDTQDQEPPRKVTDPVKPTDNYTAHKIKCEGLVTSSGIDWTILRFGAVISFNVGANPDMFMIPLDDRVEFVDTRDVGTACANAVTAKEAIGKILLIGGGKRCQFKYGDMVTRMLGAMGLPMLPEKAFTKKNFYIDWVDTTEAQEILKFQNHSLEDYIEELKRVVGFQRYLAMIFRPFAKMFLLSKSPYYKSS